MLITLLKNTVYQYMKPVFYQSKMFFNILSEGLQKHILTLYDDEEDWNNENDKRKSKVIDLYNKQQAELAKYQAELDKQQAKYQAELFKHEAELAKHEAELNEYREQERAKKEYAEIQARGLARSRAELKASGIADRIGMIETPRNKIIIKNVCKFEHSCQFNNDNVILIPNVLVGFSRQSIDNYRYAINKGVQEADSMIPRQRSATAYMLFTIWTGGMKRASTEAVSVPTNYDEAIPFLWKALDYLVSQIHKVKSGYSYLYQGEISYVHFVFRSNYYPEPKNILNWGSNISPIEIRKDFNIFTASGPDNCVIQCGRRLFGDDFNSNSINDILNNKENRPVCVFKPHSNIRHIKNILEYSNLVIDVISPVKSINVIDPNTIYLLNFNEHIGILERMKAPKRRIDVTIFRPIDKFPKCKRITMVFDIECYFDVENNQKHIPYLCCACFIYDDTPGNIMEFTGNDCVAQMIEYAVDNVNKFGFKNIELIAHNGGGYDFHYILTSMYDPSIIKSLLIRNNNFIGFSFKYVNITFYVKDSLNFLLCSLNSAAKAFLDENDRKTDFPHHELRTEADLSKVFNEWFSVDQNINIDIEKEKMLVTSDHVIKYKDNKNNKTLLEWSRIYCCNDVLVLAKIWIKFKAIVQDIFKCNIVDQTYTLAGMSFRLFESHLPLYMESMGHSRSIRLYHPHNRKEFDNMRKALIGGRCISLNGIYHNIACLDVKSLYPAAMAYYDQPYGNYRKVDDEIDWKIELGIYYCQVTPITVDGHGFFPLKKDGNVCYSNINESYCDWYTSVDMQIGRMEGHNIKVIPFEDKYVGYSWIHKDKIFKEYIENVLYKLKLNYEINNQSEHRHVIKIVMNSLWGKFAQKWMENKYSIKLEANCNLESNKCYPIFDTDYFLVKDDNKNIIASKPVQNGVFTLSWARYHMFMLWNKIVKSGTKCIYSDTDSMFINNSDIIENATFELNDKIIPIIGSEMGQLDIECVFSELICVGKKQYMGKYGIDKYKKRFKGVPMQFITPDLYAHLIKNINHTAEIQFLKFKREWGCVNGYIESKNIKQT